MKRSLTLLAAAILLYTLPLKSQSYTETFEGGVVPSCVSLVTSYTTTLSGEVINGTGSLYSNPPVNNSGTRDYLSPYLNITSTNLTISFWYMLNETLNGMAKRSLEVGLLGNNGVYQSLNTFTIDKNTPNQISKQFYSVDVTAPSTGIYRLVLKMSGDQGNGTVRIIVDDISINAALFYSAVCNQAPVAIDDSYTLVTLTSLSENVITNTVGGTDNEPNGEGMTAAMVTPPNTLEGTVILNPDGTFTFTPAPTFTGGPVTFTYQLTDKGYAPASSNIATVTINYPMLINLPIKLKSFVGSRISGQAQLKWIVADNETGDYFQILRSTDGKSFSEVGLVYVSKSVGEEIYSFIDPSTLSGLVYYKIKIINKDNSISYSNVVIVKPAAASSNQLSILRNPVKSTLYFSYTSLASGHYNVAIYTVGGTKMSNRKMYMQKGTNSLSVDLNNALPAGGYILEVTNGSERQVAKLLKQ
jgi:hypothetical protein